MITVDNIDYFPIPEFKGILSLSVAKFSLLKQIAFLNNEPHIKGINLLNFIPPIRDAIFCASSCS